MYRTKSSASMPAPKGDLAGLKQYWRKDLLAGFLVFLIALPLCLAIAKACGYPPIGGIFSAIIGGLLATFLSDSELTIKGPAAGLIVIAIGCVQDFGGGGLGPWSKADLIGYQIALGVGVAAALLQILFALFRTGILGEFFPLAAVHGMLAAIGLIIIGKQLPIAMGISAKGDPLDLLMKIPEEIWDMNPEVALIGGISLLILFLLPAIKNKYVRMIPGPMIVLLVAMPLGMWLELDHTHTYSFGGHNYKIDEQQHLVNVPNNMLDAITFPDFSGLTQLKGWNWVFLFALIGSLESMLSARAIDSIDPWKHKTNLDRDNLAVGLGNLVSSLLGGLPMISEIVRSKANIDNGARARFANLFHGLFLLVFVASVAFLIHRIPMAALGAMLVYTGFRLASPKEFANAYMIGREQLLIFLATIVAVLKTDLLQGIAIGIGVKFLIHFMNGMPLRSVFLPTLSVEERDAKTVVVKVRQAAVFTNWIPLESETFAAISPDKDVVVDLSETLLVDHTVMEKLHHLQREFAESDRQMTIVGLEDHHVQSEHPLAARRKSPSGTDQNPAHSE